MRRVAYDTSGRAVTNEWPDGALVPRLVGETSRLRAGGGGVTLGIAVVRLVRRVTISPRIPARDPSYARQSRAREHELRSLPGMKMESAASAGCPAERSGRGNRVDGSSEHSGDPARRGNERSESGCDGGKGCSGPQCPFALDSWESDPRALGFDGTVRAGTPPPADARASEVPSPLRSAWEPVGWSSTKITRA